MGKLDNSALDLIKNDTATVALNDQEVSDILSALSFFIESYPGKKCSPETMKAMKKLKERMWKVARTLG